MAWQDHAKSALRTFIENITNMTPTDKQWEEFCSHLKSKKFEKGESYAEQGEQCVYLSYIYKGLFAFSISDSEGNESIKSFNWDDYFVASYSSFITGEPSNFRIFAYEDSHVLMIDSSSLTKLFDKEMIWQKLGRLNAEGAYVRKEKRESELLIMDAEERYQSFLNSHKDIHERISGKDIAAYLGINPATLSRLKKKMS